MTANNDAIQQAREALGDARPHWNNKNGDDCGPLPFTPDELRALDHLIAVVERETWAAMPCYDAMAGQSFERAGCGEDWICPSCTVRMEKETA